MKSETAVPPGSPPDGQGTPFESEGDQTSQNIEAVLDFYTREEQKISRSQRILERISNFVGQPVSLGFILVFVALWMVAKPVQYGVGDHPERDKDQNEAEKDRLPDKVADALEDPLRAADLLLFTRVEIQNGLDILAGLVAFGFEWRALAIRWRPRRNSSFGFHQGMLLDPACTDPLEKWNVTWVAT